MNFFCDICNYKTARKDHFAKHSKTDKHISLVEKKCYELMELKKKYEKEIEDLKQDKEFFKNQLKSSNKIISKSVNALTYVIENYKHAPPLSPMTDFSFIQKNYNTDNFSEMLILKFTIGTFYKYVGNEITKVYKKENCENQSFWNTDSSRLTCVIKDPIDENNSKWVFDKKGVKTCSVIVSPTLKFIQNILINYQKSKLNTSDDDFTEKIQKKLNAAILIQLIENKVADNKIFPLIIPNFYLNKIKYV